MVLDGNNETAQNIRYNCLMALGEAQSNANARHYYLTSALETKGLKVASVVKPSAETLRGLPMRTIFNSLAVNIDPAKSYNVNKKAVWKFP